MKLYFAHGTYVGTQAEAKRLDRSFEQVEVPTDKEGLIAFLNTLRRTIYSECDFADVHGTDQFTPVVERQDPVFEVGEIKVKTHTVDLDEAFLAAPLGQQLTLAAIAVEEARRAIKPLEVCTAIPSRALNGTTQALVLVDDVEDLLA